MLQIAGGKKLHFFCIRRTKMIMVGAKVTHKKKIFIAITQKDKEASTF